jgi:transposase-like protein
MSKGGRPTKYDPGFCDAVVEAGKQGYSKAMIAAELDVVRQTLDNWAAEHPEFLDALTRAREAALAWWEKQGLLGLWSRDFNAAAYKLQVTNRFPEDWREKSEVQHSGELPVLVVKREE